MFPKLEIIKITSCLLFVAITLCRVECQYQLFDSENEFCCAGKVHPDKGGNYSYCCGNEVYDPNEKICCNEILLSNDNNLQKPDCCGEIIYSTETHVCCDGEVVPIGDIDPGDAYCCGKTVINWKENICCYDKIFPQNPDLSLGCCNDQTYQQEEQLCCYGKIYDIVDGNNDCCGDQIFNYDSHLCCDGDKLVKKENDDQICCGEGIIDESKEVCCDDKPFPKENDNTWCCGDKTYDMRTHACCDAVLISITEGKEDEMECCAKQAYNKYELFCCGEELYPRKVNESMSCCTPYGPYFVLENTSSQSSESSQEEP